MSVSDSCTLLRLVEERRLLSGKSSISWLYLCTVLIISLEQKTNQRRRAVLYPPQDNPYGIHGRGGGFQKFQMESMEWGMDSIIFPWNGGWTPYFFKMESMEWGMDSMDWGMDSILF